MLGRVHWSIEGYLVDLLEPEDEDTKIVRNVGDY